MNYPHARVENCTESLGGITFRDPYRWLENRDAEVRAWQDAQAALSSDYARGYNHFEAVHALVREYNVSPRIALPQFAGGQWFRMRIPPGGSQAQVIVSETPATGGRVLYDPSCENPDQPPFVSWISPSPNGRSIAIGICRDGSENNQILLVNVETGQHFQDGPPQTLMDNWTGGAQWLPDSSGFFFSALEGAAIDFEQNAYLHTRDKVPATTRLTIEWSTQRDYRMVVPSRDGRYAVAFERLTSPIPVAICRLDADALTWEPFVTSPVGSLAGHIVGDAFVAVTTVGAARGRLVAISLAATDPNDAAQWIELVPESAAVMRTVTPVGDSFYVTEFVDTYARVRIFDSEGNSLGTVPLPDRGAVLELPFPIMTLARRGHPDAFVFGFSSFKASPAIYSHSPDASEAALVEPPAALLDDVCVEDRHAKSADGTTVPYHIVRRRAVETDRPHPTLIYGYGGYNTPIVPEYPGPLAAFIAAGGVYVHAHLRGGGELGLDWWEGGRMANKTNGFADVCAVAEDLIASGISVPDKLALTGGSNGGLMAAAAAIRRPDLWSAVIPRVPFLDLIGACRDSYGRMCVQMEYADVEDPNEVARLAGFSPYQQIVDAVDYPAFFIHAGATDPRCPAWHARKFAARMQAASSGEGPILLHVWDNVGHGWATDKDVAASEYTEILSSLMRHLGVETMLERSSGLSTIAPQSLSDGGAV